MVAPLDIERAAAELSSEGSGRSSTVDPSLNPLLEETEQARGPGQANSALSGMSFYNGASHGQFLSAFRERDSD